MSYTFNGELGQSSQAAIVESAIVPMFWEGRGKVQKHGFMITQPQLNCPDSAQPCQYVPGADNAGNPNNRTCGTGNGSSMQWFGADGPMTIHTGGQNWAYSDSHVKFHHMGMSNNPFNDPFTAYDTGGNILPTAGMYWDNCHALLFRPDLQSSWLQ